MGLLDYLQDDPQKQAALRQGLLNAGIAMMGSQSPNLMGSVAQGANAGMTAYQKEFEAEKLRLENEKRKSVFQDAIKAGQGTPAKQMAQIGGNIYANPKDAQFEVQQNQAINQLRGLPQATPMATQTFGLPKTQPVTPRPLTANPEDAAMSQVYDNFAAQIPEQGAPAEIAAETLREQVQMIGGEQSGFDPRKMALALMQSGDPEYMKTGFDVWSKLQADKPAEQFGKIMPHAYTPASLAKYQQSGNYADLQPIQSGADFGKVNPGQFTPESLARFAETGQYGDLVPFRAPVQIDQGDRKTLYDPGSRGMQSFRVNPKVDDTPEYKAAQTQAVEGAKLQVERQSNAPKARAALTSFENKTKNLNAHIDAATKQAGFWTTGFIGNALEGVAGSPSHDLSKRLDSIKASLGFAELQAMRDNSPTGGALGSITERELALLQSAWDSVAQSQSKDQFIAALKNVKQINDQALRNAREAYANTYNKRPSGGANPSNVLSPREILQVELRDAESRGDTRNAQLIREELRRLGVKTTTKDLPKKPPQGVDPKLWKYMTPEERKLWQK